MREPQVIKWLLDTRSLWPAATATNHLVKEASRALALLSPEEQSSILKYHFVRDAKMALASALLKRHAITSSCASVPWAEALCTRNEHAKPIFRLPDGTEPLIFNVSHQAGLVCLLGVDGPPSGMFIGVDVVCPVERRDRDYALVAEGGWYTFVEMYDSVFSPGETARLKGLSFAEGGGRLSLDGKLGYFYVLWCLREAYVKMTGEALLAEWLGELEMRYFAPPGRQAPGQEKEGKADGRTLEVWFRGAKVEDVDVTIEWCLTEYMICTAVKGNRPRGLNFENPWTLLDIDEVLDAAERANLR